jgi:hypothetical protein
MHCTGFGAFTVLQPVSFNSDAEPGGNSAARWAVLSVRNRALGTLAKLQEKDFSASRLPATLSLHVNRSPQQVIDFSCFPALRLLAIAGSIR